MKKKKNNFFYVPVGLECGSPQFITEEIKYAHENLKCCQNCNKKEHCKHVCEKVFTRDEDEGEDDEEEKE